MREFVKCSRIVILCFLFISVVPIFLLSHRLRHINSDVSKDFVEDLSIIKHRTEAQTLSAVEQEDGEGLKEPALLVFKDDTSNSTDSFSSGRDAGFTADRVEADGDDVLKSNATGNGSSEGGDPGKDDKLLVSGLEEESNAESVQRNMDAHTMPPRRTLDEKVKEMKDQVIRAKAYLNFAPANTSSHLVKELKLRIKEVERALSQSNKDSRLSRSSMQKMRAMEATLTKASRIFPDCTAMVKKLRAMTYNAEQHVRAQMNQESFLKGLGGRTIPKGLHCLSMKLTADYFILGPEEQKFPNKHKLRRPDLYHLAIFSDNILACSVVVNSTISATTAPEKIVFHIVTDSLNFPAMSMWFLSNPPGKSTVHVESIDNFQWLSTKYNATLQKEGSFDPRYTSELNHLRFYLPDVFPFLNKIVLLDHDVVVQRDLIKLWHVNMRGKVNGAVQTCKEGEPSFRRMDMFINFTDPIIANRFDSKSCSWAFGMNVFDLQEWRRRTLTELYHKYLDMGNKIPLWREGSLPIGWITFYKQTVALDKRWHVLGLGYESGVRKEDVEQAAVLHFDGILKPWLDIGIEKYKHLWKKHVNYEHPYLQQCNIHE